MRQSYELHLLALVAGKDVVDGIVGNGRQAATVADIQVGAPHRLAREHLRAAPRPVLDDVQQDGLLLVSIAFVAGHKVGQREVFRFVQPVAALQGLVCPLLDGLPAGLAGRFVLMSCLACSMRWGV